MEQCFSHGAIERRGSPCPVAAVSPSNCRAEVIRLPSKDIILKFIYLLFAVPGMEPGALSMLVQNCF